MRGFGFYRDARRVGGAFETELSAFEERTARTEELLARAESSSRELEAALASLRSVGGARPDSTSRSYHDIHSLRLLVLRGRFAEAEDRALEIRRMVPDERNQLRSFVDISTSYAYAYAGDAAGADWNGAPLARAYEAVVTGLDPDVTYRTLGIAASAIRAGAQFVATNADLRYPTPGGLMPGAGAIVAALVFAGLSSSGGFEPGGFLLSVSVGVAIALGAVIGLALGILVSVTTDIPLAPEIGLVLGALIGWLWRREHG